MGGAAKKSFGMALFSGRLCCIFCSSPFSVISDRERIGSVVECLTRDQGAAGSGLTGVTTLWPLSKTHLS